VRRNHFALVALCVGNVLLCISDDGDNLLEDLCRYMWPCIYLLLGYPPSLCLQLHVLLVCVWLLFDQLVLGIFKLRALLLRRWLSRLIRLVRLARLACLASLGRPARLAGLVGSAGLGDCRLRYPRTGGLRRAPSRRPAPALLCTLIIGTSLRLFRVSKYVLVTRVRWDLP
jgi:hypothetical protein